MPCYHPAAAWQLADGSITFVERGPIVKRLDMPCGQCIGCRLERTRQWAVRCVHEAQMHGANNAFITLTYDDQHLPSPPNLNYRDFQLFLKRLRKAVAPTTIRFFMCGEYGDQTSRPHFHACIFGYRFPDRKPWSKGKSGSINYRSALLEKVWPYGQSLVGDVTYQSASYIASYIIKKVNGDLAEQHYRSIDPLTGEVFQRTPEFCQASLKPGIGASWYEKYGSRSRSFDSVVINGRETKPPKYYDKLHRRRWVFEDLPDDVFGPPRMVRVGVDTLRDVKEEREYKNMSRPDYGFNNTPERDAVREEVAVARRNFYKVRKGEL